MCERCLSLILGLKKGVIDCFLCLMLVGRKEGMATGALISYDA